MNEAVRTRQHLKLVREGALVAEVEVALRNPDTPNSWGPCLTPQDARKLDAVRQALRTGDIATARKLSREVYLLHPIQDAEEIKIKPTPGPANDYAATSPSKAGLER